MARNIMGVGWNIFDDNEDPFTMNTSVWTLHSSCDALLW